MPSIVQQVDGRWYFGFEHGDKHRDRCFNTLRPHSLRAITQNRLSCFAQRLQEALIHETCQVLPKHLGKGERPTSAACACGAFASSPLFPHPWSDDCGQSKWV